ERLAAVGLLVERAHEGVLQIQGGVVAHADEAHGADRVPAARAPLLAHRLGGSRHARPQAQVSNALGGAIGGLLDRDDHREGGQARTVLGHRDLAPVSGQRVLRPVRARDAFRERDVVEVGRQRLTARDAEQGSGEPDGPQGAPGDASSRPICSSWGAAHPLDLRAHPSALPNVIETAKKTATRPKSPYGPAPLATASATRKKPREPRRRDRVAGARWPRSLPHPKAALECTEGLSVAVQVN